MIQSKNLYYCFFCISILFIACKAKQEPNNPAPNLVNIEETPLPNGKFILQDENTGGRMFTDTAPASMNSNSGITDDSNGISTEESDFERIH